MHEVTFDGLHLILAVALLVLIWRDLGAWWDRRTGRGGVR